MNSSTSPERYPTEAQPPTPIADRVIALVHAHANGIGRTAIATALGVPPATVGSALSRAVTEGQVRRIGRGTYAPTVDAEQRADVHGAATDWHLMDSQRRDGIKLKHGRMGRQEGLLITAADGYGEAFIPRDALPDLRRRLARAQARIEARP